MHFYILFIYMYRNFLLSCIALTHGHSGCWQSLTTPILSSVPGWGPKTLHSAPCASHSSPPLKMLYYRLADSDLIPTFVIFYGY